jgi:ATP-dependent RNA helicase DeaD
VELAERLEARGFSASALNGDLSQQLRERTINRLKKGELDILVATDVAARGLDVERISHVVNYDIPYDNESYVHRIGRTGRAGRDGQAILFVTPKERRLLSSIEKSTRQPIAVMALPTGQEVSDQRVQQFQEQVLSAMGTENLDKFRSLIASMSKEQEVDPLELAAALAFLQQKDRPLFPKYQDAPPPREHGDDRPERSRERSERRERDEPRRRSTKHREFEDLAMETYRLEVGRDHGVQPKDIVGAIANEADLDSQYIGRIEIYPDHTTVDLPQGMPKELLQHLRKMRICQQPSGMKLLGEQEDFKPRKSFKSSSKPGGSNSKPKTRIKPGAADKSAPRKRKK